MLLTLPQRGDDESLPDPLYALDSSSVSRKGGATMSSVAGLDVLAFLASFMLLVAILFGAV